ncbi:phosphate propanoyltransferase [Paenibacillus sp. MBLB4367]|uniref:phosphate propanoyltransferase n=1 Tax=Paenibacillus sp. MBLB4367 TaxID=3384767 RepID=UPI003907EB27
MAFITETSLRVLLPRGIPDPFPLGEGDKLTPAAADFLKDRGIRIGIPKLCRQTVPSGHEDPLTATIPVGVSNRHVHLSPEHIERLFGTGYRLTPQRELSQKGQFAAEETVTVAGPKGSLAKVRVLGPSRGASQVEISRTDGYFLGIHPPVRLSGQIRGTPGVTLSGPEGTVALDRGLIVARNHVHMSPEDARRFGVSQGDRLIVKSAGERPVLYADVVVRVDERFTLELHLDTDEGNAADVKTGELVRVVGVNGRLNGGMEV